MAISIHHALPVHVSFHAYKQSILTFSWNGLRMRNFLFWIGHNRRTWIVLNECVFISNRCCKNSCLRFFFFNRKPFLNTNFISKTLFNKFQQIWMNEIGNIVYGRSINQKNVKIQIKKQRTKTHIEFATYSL